jgi:hypothetical protein
MRSQTGNEVFDVILRPLEDKIFQKMKNREHSAYLKHEKI